MALINCKYCEKKVSGRAKKCPHCGGTFIEEEKSFTEKQDCIHCEECDSEIPQGVLTCLNCGCPIIEQKEKSIIFEKEELAALKKLKEKKITSKLIIIAVAICIFLGSFMVANNTLWGDDKIAYELVLDIAYFFKDPSSVQIISGTVGTDGDCLFCGISAKNGFGARGTDYYYVSDGQIVESENPISIYTTKDNLNIDKINKKLSQTLGDYD